MTFNSLKPSTDELTMLTWTHHNRTKLALLCALAYCCLLAGCDRGEAAAAKEEEREIANKEGDGRATGGACRQAGRALEDCYTLNPTAQRAAVFAGWRDMNDYMRENKMADVKPTIEAPKPADAGGAEVKEH